MKEWRPHKRQEAFLAIPDTVFEGMYGGAAGGGKSELIMLLPILRGFIQNPRFKGLLLRRTFPELEASLIVRSHEFYKPSGGDYNSQLHRWKFPSGAFVDFGYCEHDKDARRYDTAEYNYVGFDELTSFTEFQYLYITSRCRTSTHDLPAFIRSATNPGNVGHGWVRKRFVEPHPEGGAIIDDGDSRRIFIPAKLTDNPHLMGADPDYQRRLEMLPEAEKRAKLYGDWWTFAGQAFEEWRVEPFPGEPENARHTIKPFDIPSWWPRILAIDWGFAAMLWSGWGAISPDARFYIYREYTARKKKIAEWASDIARISQGEELSAIVLDPSAWQRRGDPKTIMEQFKEHSKMSPERADNDRIGGKLLLHEFLRFTPKPPRQLPIDGFDADLASKILRWKGEATYREYLKQFEPEVPETNLPRLQVFDTCSVLIECIPKCIYKQKEGEKPEDVQEFDGDDPYDGLRYLLKAVDRYVSESKGKFVELQKTAAVVEKLQSDGDMTGFYRRMEFLEAQKKLRNQAVKVFHEHSKSFDPSRHAVIHTGRGWPQTPLQNRKTW